MKIPLTRLLFRRFRSIRVRYVNWAPSHHSEKFVDSCWYQIQNSNATVADIESHHSHRELPSVRQSWTIFNDDVQVENENTSLPVAVSTRMSMQCIAVSSWFNCFVVPIPVWRACTMFFSPFPLACEPTTWIEMFLQSQQRKNQFPRKGEEGAGSNPGTRQIWCTYSSIGY